MRISEGFGAWLSTTDDRRPLKDYKTVLEGTLIQIRNLEEEHECAIKELATCWGTDDLEAVRKQIKDEVHQG